MKNKKAFLLILVLIIVILLIVLLHNCDPGKIFEPTITSTHIPNTSTSTSTSTSTPIPPTFTLTPTLTQTVTPTYTLTPPDPRTLTCTYRISAFKHSTARQYLDTGLDLKKGETLIIKATGIACCDPNPSICCSGPDGHPSFTNTDLVGKIGYGSMFHIGSSFQKNIFENDAGRLYLGYNDLDYKNNSGFFDVTVIIKNVLVGNCNP